jgi:Peptidase A4 family
MNVGRGVAAVVAVVVFLSCAPAWASTDAGHSPAMHRLALMMGHLPSSAVGRLSASARAGSTVQTATFTRPAVGHLKLTPSSLTYRGGHMKLGWSASNATVCTLSAKPLFWAGPNPARVKCRGKLTATLPALALGVHWTFTFKAKNAAGKTSVVRRTLTLHKPPFAVSSNWSGYVVPSTTPITSVSGQFTVPTLNCKKTPTAGEAAWVGTGGAGSSTGDLLQTGVVSDCVGGTQVENPGWWEEYPEYPAKLFTGMTVSPGDQIVASVSQGVDLTWTTRLDDLTTHVSGVMHTGDQWGTVLDSDPTTFVTTHGDPLVTYTGGLSAEWIVEDYGTDAGPVPFADFGTVAFTNLTTNLASWSLTNKEKVGLGDRSGLLLAAPSNPDSTGKGFSVSYTG